MPCLTLDPTPDSHRAAAMGVASATQSSATAPHAGREFYDLRIDPPRYVTDGIFLVPNEPLAMFGDMAKPLKAWWT